MGATKEYYAEINEKFTDEQLQEKGWSKKRIGWLRFAFGPGAESDFYCHMAECFSDLQLLLMGWSEDNIQWLRDWCGPCKTN